MSNDAACENKQAFFDRLRPFFAPKDLLHIEHAYMLSKYCHRWQVRKELGSDGEPLRYFEHPRRVTLILIDEAKVIDRDIIIAGLLHDGFEDTRDLTPELVEHCFGSDVTGVIKVLSKTPKEGYLDRFVTSTDWRPYLVKACDRLDNMRSLDQSTREFQQRQVDETRDKYYPLFERMLHLCPTQYVDRARYIRDKVLVETERRATILEMTSNKHVQV